MKSDEYRKRKKIEPGQLVSTGRYVMGAIRSHKRPVIFPIAQRPVDRPDTRGLTEL
jgi:hypothetical protein